ncbi:MAG: S26 family signal peptidase [Jatrophihabitantaceae bacterium]
MLAAVSLGARRTLVIVEVEGESMLPSLRPGERVLAARLGGPRALHRGEVVVCRQPGRRDGRPYLIKRVRALAGDPAPTVARSTRGECDDGRTIASGEVWIQGDHDPSYDSRTFGPLGDNQVVARMIGRLAPSRRLRAPASYPPVCSSNAASRDPDPGAR